MTTKEILLSNKTAFSLSAVLLVVSVVVWCMRLEARVATNETERALYDTSLEKALGQQMGFQTVILDKLTAMDQRLSRMEGKLERQR